MSILEKLIKNSTIKEIDLLTHSSFMETTTIRTSVPMLNAALSGSLNGGLTSGLTFIVGPSKHFKTAFALATVKAYQDQINDGVVLFYDSEFGASKDYFESFDIDADRVLHNPIMNIEELKHDLVTQLDKLEKKDNVFIFIDSIGNLASKKEIDDAIDGKSVADMTRAKQLKSLFRMVTPYLIKLDIPMVAVNHSYKTIEMFSKEVMSGGTGGMYSANTVLMVGKAQEKDGKELAGYKFTINIEKSRFVKEKSKFPIIVTFDGGISKWSGMLEVALELGYVEKPKLGWYTRIVPDKEGVLMEDKNWRAKETNCAEFWLPILEKTNFAKAVEKRFKLAQVQMLEKDEDND